MNEKAIVNNNFDEKIVHEENDREVKLAPFMTLQIGVSTVQMIITSESHCVCCGETLYSLINMRQLKILFN